MTRGLTTIRRLALTPSLLVSLSCPVEVGAGAIPTDPDFVLQWGLHNTGQEVDGSAGTVGADVDILDAWDIHGGAAPVTVAIVGSGVDGHPEFANRLLTGRAFIGDTFDTSDTTGSDTHAAGIIGAARDNGVGITGINPHVRILPVPITDGPLSSELVAAEGITWAVDQGAHVIVVTRTYRNGSAPLANAIAYAAGHDVVVIAPAGDEENPEVLYPAAFDGCIAVTATTNRDEFAPISNYGPQVDISAPGQDVWSTATGNGYEYRTGSTVAAAFVAGAAALVRSYAPQLTAEEIRAVLMVAAVDLGETGWDQQFGDGRLDVAAALRTAEPPALRFEPIDIRPTTFPPDDGAVFDVNIVGVAGSVQPASPVLIHREAGGSFDVTALAPLGGGSFRVTLPPTGCGEMIEYYLRAHSLLGQVVSDPIDAPGVLYQARAIVENMLFHDDFETDSGWTTEPKGALNSDGAWTRVTPNGTSAQPGFDATAGPGGMCYLTGQHFGGGDWLGDVDGGPFRLVSPAIDLPAAFDVEVSYRRWFHSVNGEPDTLWVDATTNGGATWITIEQVASTSGWVDQVFRLSEFLELSGTTLRVRFSAKDDPSDSITEAALDEFRVRALLCTRVPGDANGDGAVNLGDLAALVGCLRGPDVGVNGGPCGGADLERDGVVDLNDFRLLQLRFRLE